jgi:hypothetical protein
MLPATAPVTAPAACLVSGTFGLEFDSFAMTAVYMRSTQGTLLPKPPPRTDLARVRPRCGLRAVGLVEPDRRRPRDPSGSRERERKRARSTRQPRVA